MLNDAINSGDLQIKNLYKTYKKRTVVANCDISTVISPNQIVALIGHNGAGKTTLLNQICGNLKPDSGDIIYKGISLKNNPNWARHVVSTMPQFYAPLAGVTLRQSIESILYIRGVSGVKVEEKTEEILADLDIKKWEKYSGEQLSGGLQRLTSFAMAVASPTSIILLDEPTNDVDPVRRGLIWNYMRRLAQTGHIVVVVTHNLLEVEQYADRYIMLDKGKIVQDIFLKRERGTSQYSTLYIELLGSAILANYPEAIDIKHQDDGLIILRLTLDQVSNAISWLLRLIELGRIVKYRLETETLSTVYGGLLDG